MNFHDELNHVFQMCVCVFSCVLAKKLLKIERNGSFVPDKFKQEEEEGRG